MIGGAWLVFQLAGGTAAGVACAAPIPEENRRTARELFVAGQQLESRRLQKTLVEWKEMNGDTRSAGQTLLAEAEREFRAALAADPGTGDAHHNLAVVCLVDGRLDEAERELRLAEKAGVPIHPRLKDELRKRRRDAGPGRK